jgi:hypothetical protein
VHDSAVVEGVAGVGLEGGCLPNSAEKW